MNYQAFTDEALLMMHHSARGALVADDELARLGEAPRFQVRATLNWTMHIAELEAELARRGTNFEVIEWSSPDHPPQPPSMGVVDGLTLLSARIASVMRVRRP
jgi:hypothetical protein